MKETETIGRIAHPSGRTYKILEMLSTEQGTFLLEGEQLQPFSSEIFKAIQSGYLLKDCADDRLRSTWRRLAEQGEIGRMVVSPSTETKTEAEVVNATNVTELPEAPIAQPETWQDPEASEASTDYQDAPHEQEPQTFPLRDRRSPESPASEEIRLRIAARDREMDSLMAKFPIQESSEAEVTEARDDVVAIPVDSVSHVDVTFQVNPAKPVVEDRPEPTAAIANIADAPEVKTDDDVKPESAKAEVEIPENPFALF